MSHSVKVALMRGPAFYWAKACEYTQGKGSFSVAELAGCTCGVANSTVQQWVNAMKRQGELKVVGSKPSIAGKNAFLYAVARVRSEAPAVRGPDFQGTIVGRAQQQLWNAMRMLPQWSIQELAVAASTDDRPVPRNTAGKYVAALARAGMVIEVTAASASKGKGVAYTKIWRLLRQHNRGPHAPEVRQARFVYDPNRDSIIGDGEVFS